MLVEKTVIVELVNFGSDFGFSKNLPKIERREHFIFPKFNDFLYRQKIRPALQALAVQNLKVLEKSPLAYFSLKFFVFVS